MQEGLTPIAYKEDKFLDLPKDLENCQVGDSIIIKDDWSFLSVRNKKIQILDIKKDKRMKKKLVFNRLRVLHYSEIKLLLDLGDVVQWFYYGEDFTKYEIIKKEKCKNNN